MATTSRPIPRTLTSTFTRTLAATLAGLALTATAQPASAADVLPPGRRLVEHTVRPGETATGLAVRFHAWTAELLAHNHLGPTAALHVGQHLEIPVVAALPHHPRPARHQTQHPTQHPTQHRARPAPDPAPARASVRRTVSRTAARRGVDPQLALAVSWQESGWQMDRRSGAGAIGAMQVLPATADWMSLYVGRRLHPHRLADNTAAGVELLRVLDDQTRSRRHQVGAYYQGLGAVRDHGLYPETRDYVANVLAIKQRLEAGRPPA